MSALENAKDKFKDFIVTTWAIKNKTVDLPADAHRERLGVYKFNTLPKEQFPDIVIPTIYVSTIYTGNSPKDMENLVTRPIENRSRPSRAPRSINSPAPPSRTIPPSS
jgi:multidrug efflux pump